MTNEGMLLLVGMAVLTLWMLRKWRKAWDAATFWSERAQAWRDGFDELWEDREAAHAKRSAAVAKGNRTRAQRRRG